MAVASWIYSEFNNKELTIDIYVSFKGELMLDSFNALTDFTNH